MSSGPENSLPASELKHSLPEDNICTVCCEVPTFIAVGSCDHPICYKCSARMRVLSKQVYCSSCRADMDQVIFSKSIKKFSSFPLQRLPGNRKYGIRFENKMIQSEFHSLLENICVLCSKDNIFSTFQDLKSHLRKVHDKQVCDICVENLSLFPCELKIYSKKDLVKHRKEGDEDEKSHRGHPECRFCSERFFDNDHLLLHLRKNHFWCHFCEHDGKQDYYDVYDDLRRHFANQHYLCDEGNCVNEKYTSVFRDKIDYQAHKLAQHAKKMNKLQTKEARKVEIDIRYERRQQYSNLVNGSDYEDVNREESKKTRKGLSSSRQDFASSSIEKIGYEYDDVLKERKNIEVRTNHQEKSKSQESSKTQSFSLGDDPPNASPSVSLVESTSRSDYRQANENDGVIGMPEHINKQSNETASKVTVESTVKVKEKNENLSAIRIDNNALKVESDFPSLPGSSFVPFQPTKSFKEKHDEAFPALGAPIKLGNIEIAATNKYTAPCTSILSMPVKSKKKSTGKWSKQREEVEKANEDFPSLNSLANQAVPTNSQNQKLLVDIVKTENMNGAKKKRPPGLSTPKQVVVENNSQAIKQVVVENNSQTIKQVVVENNSQTIKSSSKYPPGLDPPKTFIQNKSAPPGLSVKFSSDSDEMKQKLHLERNLNLLSTLKVHLDDLSLSVFKDLSGDFRRGLVTSDKYYQEISDLLGDNIKYVFSELVALLPDEQKRQELLIAHNNIKVLAKQSKGLSNADYTSKNQWKAQNVMEKEEQIIIESKCPECGNVFPQDQALSHMESHKESFPALPVAVIKKNYSFNSSNGIRNAPLKNAWAK